jgi:flagellar basal-body rod protein FlgB
MFSTDGILGRNFAVASAALDGLALRQQVHAENLANIDTKGYQAKTVDFERVLGSAMRGENPGNRFTGPFAGGGAVNDARMMGGLTGQFVTTNRGDGKVSRTTETSMMMNDNIRFRVLTQQVTNQISAVKSVIAEMGRG